MHKFIVILFVALLSYGCDSPQPVKKRRPGTYVVKRQCDLAAAIKAGDYKFVHPWIKPKNFPEPEDCEEGEEVEVRLFSPKKLGKKDGIIVRDALIKLEKKGCRPVGWTVLLPLGAKYPHLQLKHWILALGTPWKTPRGQAALMTLHSHNNARSLNLTLGLNNPNGKWKFWDQFRFAATCKKRRK